jgi:hypothetical protein
VKKLGARRNIFQSADVRAETGYADKTSEYMAMHNEIKRLRNDGLLETVDDTTTRKRNLYWRIVEGREADVDRRIARLTTTPAAGNGASRQTPVVDEAAPNGDNARSGPPRVRYLEDRVDGVEEQIVHLDQRFTDLFQRLDDLDQRLNDLIVLWS